MENPNKKLQFTVISQDSNLYKAIEKVSTMKQYRKGEMIYFQDDPSDKFYLIQSGRVRLFLTSKEGNELTLEILGVNQIFGEASYFSHASRLTSVNAITDVELLTVDLNHLLPYLTQDPNLIVEMIAFMAQRIQILSIQVSSMTFLSSEKKVAHILIQLGTYFKEHESDMFYSIDYTHENIAKLIGIARVTTTKILKSFLKKGWVSLEYRKVKVLDETALKEFLLASQE